MKRIGKAKEKEKAATILRLRTPRGRKKQSKANEDVSFYIILHISTCYSRVFYFLERFFF